MYASCAASWVNASISASSLSREWWSDELGAGVGHRRVGVRRDQQERLRPQPPGPDARDVGEQLVATEAEGADDARRERVLGDVARGIGSGTAVIWKRHLDRLVLEQAADDAADRVAARALRVAAGSLRDRRMEVRALQADPAGAREAVEHEVPAPAQQPGLKAV